MSYQIPYHRERVVVPNVLLDGNEQSSNPVAFHLCPAWGPDLARIKSIIFATTGLALAEDWTADFQESVIRAFDTGSPGFVSTVEVIEGLTIPAVMAKRAGLIPDLPLHTPPGESTPKPNPDAPIPVVSGIGFSKICGHATVLPLALWAAGKIAELSQAAHRVDARFFAQPSGSGGAGTPGPRRSTAKRARRTSRRPETAAGPDQTASQPAGTSDPGPSN